MQFADKPPLLCGSDSEKLQLLSITTVEVNSIQNETLNEVMLRNKYHDVFNGLGKIGDPPKLDSGVEQRFAHGSQKAAQNSQGSQHGRS